MHILPNINGHEDLVRLNDQQRADLCDEIRSFLVSGVSRTGGHLASNLGAVELTVAIETVFNTMEDRLVFDVGHQSYVHKLLTGRQADFGICGSSAVSPDSPNLLKVSPTLLWRVMLPVLFLLRWVWPGQEPCRRRVTM